MLPHLLLNVKPGGRDGLASGEPLRRRCRADVNNGVLRLLSLTDLHTPVP